MLRQSTLQACSNPSRYPNGGAPEIPSLAELRDLLKANAECLETAERVDFDLAYQRLLALPTAEHTTDGIEALIELAKNLHFAGESEKALHAASHAALMADSHGERALLCTAHAIEGLLFSELGRFSEAMTAHFERLCLARELGDKTRELLAINGIGTVFAAIG